MSEGKLVAYIDREVLGINHMYKRPAWRRSEVCCYFLPDIISYDKKHLLYGYRKFETLISFKCCRLAPRIPHMKVLLKKVFMHGAMLILS